MRATTVSTACRKGTSSSPDFDFDSGRSTASPPLERVLTSTIQELTNVKLTLEPAASLDVHVFLPNDASSSRAAGIIRQEDVHIEGWFLYISTTRRNAAWRSLPELVHSTNSTSTGRTGRTHVTSFIVSASIALRPFGSGRL
jgi:hypothetical protein